MINNKYVFPLISAEDKQLPIYVVTVGSETLINNDEETKMRTIRPSGIVDHQFLFTTEGEATVLLEDGEYNVGSNTLLYHAPNTPHYYEGISEVWTSYWITFAMQENFTLFKLKSGVYELNDITSYVDLISQMSSLRNNFHFGEDSSVLLYKMIIRLIRQLSKNITNEISTLLKPSVRYLRKHFAEEIDLTLLAELTGVTPGYYCKIFKNCYHIRPFEYIQLLRIQRAKSLLFSSPSKSIAEIGAEVGFHSPSYFIKQFKQQELITPYEFRSTHGTLLS